jgi:hypothetical protein
MLIKLIEQCRKLAFMLSRSFREMQKERKIARTEKKTVAVKKEVSQHVANAGFDA